MDKIKLRNHLLKERFNKKRSFSLENYQRTTSNVVVAIAVPVVINIRQSAVPAIAAVEAVGVPEIASDRP